MWPRENNASINLIFFFARPLDNKFLKTPRRGAYFGTEGGRSLFRSVTVYVPAPCIAENKTTYRLAAK